LFERDDFPFAPPRLDAIGAEMFARNQFDVAQRAKETPATVARNCGLALWMKEARGRAFDENCLSRFAAFDGPEERGEDFQLQFRAAIRTRLESPRAESGSGQSLLA